MDVLKGFKLRGKRGDALRAWLHLYPGDIQQHVAVISAAMKEKYPKTADLTLGEYNVWHGLLLEETVCVLLRKPYVLLRGSKAKILSSKVNSKTKPIRQAHLKMKMAGFSERCLARLAF
jgi:hypothetical protein